MARRAKINSVPSDPQALAHELNNELGVIIAECDLLESTLKEEDIATFRHLEAIKTAAHRIAGRISICP